MTESKIDSASLQLKKAATSMQKRRSKKAGFRQPNCKHFQQLLRHNIQQSMLEVVDQTKEKPKKSQNILDDDSSSVESNCNKRGHNINISSLMMHRRSPTNIHIDFKSKSQGKPNTPVMSPKIDLRSSNIFDAFFKQADLSPHNHDLCLKQPIQGKRSSNLNV